MWGRQYYSGLRGNLKKYYLRTVIPLTDRAKKRKQEVYLLGILFFLSFSLLSLPAREVIPLVGKEYTERVKKVIEGAKESVLVVMFHMRYYPNHPTSPSNQLIESLIRAKRRGVRVRVILDISPEEKGKYSNLATGKYLSRKGVEVRFDSLNKTTHSKLVIVDERFVVVGSHNWTYYGLTQNQETSVLIDSPELAGELIGKLKEEFLWKDGK